MFNTAWTDLVLKLGGQILLAVLVILAITFGADSSFPKKNTEEMIGSRSEQPANTSQTNAAAAQKNASAVKTNAAAAQKNAAVKTNASAAQQNNKK